MAEFLVIRLGKNPADPVHWIAADSAGVKLDAPASGSLPDAKAAIGVREVIVLVPSADVLTTTVDIPIRGGAKLQAALPYALEEYLAEDIDKLHFAAGPKRSSGKTPVSVVSHERMQEWLSALAEADIQPSSIIADSYGLARIPGTISMLLVDDQVFINDGEDTELVMEGVSPGDALAAIGAIDDGGSTPDEDAARLPRHLLVYCEAADEGRYQHDWIALREELDSVDVKLLADGIVPRLAVTVATGAGVNLLQGPYGAKKEYSGLFRPWKTAAMLFLAFIVIGTAAKAADYFMLLREETRLKEQFNAEYQQMLPGAPATDDPARVIESLKRRTGTVTTVPLFLESMELLSRALQQNQDARIQAISYRSGIVTVQLSAPNVATLASIEDAIGNSGRFQASIQDTNSEGDVVKGRIQIRETGS